MSKLRPERRVDQKNGVVRRREVQLEETAGEKVQKQNVCSAGGGSSGQQGQERRGRARKCASMCVWCVYMMYGVCLGGMCVCGVCVWTLCGVCV